MGIGKIRGAFKSAAYDMYVRLWNLYKPDLVLLTESHVNEVAAEQLRQWAGVNWNLHVLPAIGASGGIAVLWRDSIETSSFVNVERQLVIGTITSTQGLTWALCGVYGSNDDDERKVVWAAISETCNLNIPVLCAFQHHS